MKNTPKIVLLSIAQFADKAEGVFRLVRFKGIDGKDEIALIPVTITTSLNELRKCLLNKGFSYSKEPAYWHTVFDIVNADTQHRTTLVRTPGFHGGRYVFHDGTSAPNEKRTAIFLYLDGLLVDVGSGPTGDLEKYLKLAAHALRHSSRLTLALCAAYSSPLLHLAKLQGGGFHFFGDSTAGKTTTLRLANSAIYAPEAMVTWSATETAVEELAAFRNDSLLCFDELGSLDGSPDSCAAQIRKLIYKLANGQSRARSRISTGARYGMRVWRTTILSTGEQSLAVLARSNRTSRFRGEEVRMIDIPCDAGAGLGIFESLPPKCADADVFRSRIWDVTESNFGIPFRQYMDHVVSCVQADREAFEKRLRALMTEYRDKAGVGDCVDSLSRMVDRFAIAYAGGVLALEAHALRGERDDIFRGVSACMDASIGREMRERRKALESGIESLGGYLRASDLPYVDLAAWDEDLAAIIELAPGFMKTIKIGKKKVRIAMLKTETVENAVPDANVRRKLLRLLAAKGVLRADAEGNLTRATSIGPKGTGRPRVYWFTRKPTIADLN